MNSARTRITGVAAIALGGMLVTAPSALAQGPGYAGLQVSPASAAPGTSVEFTALNCDQASGISSDAVSDFKQVSQQDSKTVWRGTIKDVSPGKHDVQYTCGDTTVRGALEVTGGGGAGGGGMMPSGGAQTGGGAMADGGNAAGVSLGAGALAAVMTGAGVWTLRRRTSS